MEKPADEKFKTPIFIPLIADKSVLKSNPIPKAVAIEASTVLWRPGLLPIVKSKIPSIIRDPGTGRIKFEHSRNENFNKLPYAVKVQEENKLHSDPTFRLEKLVIPCINFQKNTWGT